MQPDERRTLFRELTVAAQETRLLIELTEAVSATAEAAEIAQLIEYGVRTVLPIRNWRKVHFALLDERSRQVRIYDMAGGDVSRYWENVRRGALAAGRDLGVAVEFVVGTASGSASQQLRFDEALHDEVDGIALAPIDAIGIEPRIAAAQAAGIPVITFDTPPVPGSAALAYVGTNNRIAGRLAGDAMRRLLPDGGLLALSVDTLQAANGVERVAGFTEILADGSYELLPTIEEEYDSVRGLALTRAVLAEHPDLAGAFGAWGANGPTWGSAAESVGRQGQIPIVCFDLTASSVEMLKNGTAAALIAQREHEIAYRSVELLCRQLVAGELPDLPPTREYDTRVDVVTLERTPWSVALPDYIRAQLVRRPADAALRAALDAHGRRLRIRMIGMAEATMPAPAEQRVAWEDQTPLGRALSSGIVQVVDPTVAGDHQPLVAADTRTLVVAPMLTQGQALGALLFEHTQPGAAAAAPLALIERVAGIVGVVLDRARLLRQTEQRAVELSIAAERQDALLQTILELSSPVVPIAAGILVLPLVGALDTYRAARLLDTLLTEVSARRAEIVIIDITGVPVVDTAVAHALLQTARATQLLGAEVVLVGITPAVAQTIVQLGVNLADMTTRADLASGFVYALTRRGGRITYQRW